jgi:hypothetical protein
MYGLAEMPLVAVTGCPVVGLRCPSGEGGGLLPGAGRVAQHVARVIEAGG